MKLHDKVSVTVLQYHIYSASRCIGIAQIAQFYQFLTYKKECTNLWCGPYIQNQLYFFYIKSKQKCFCSILDSYCGESHNLLLRSIDFDYHICKRSSINHGVGAKAKGRHGGLQDNFRKVDIYFTVELFNF